MQKLNKKSKHINKILIKKGKKFYLKINRKKISNNSNLKINNNQSNIYQNKQFKNNNITNLMNHKFI